MPIAIVCLSALKEKIYSTKLAIMINDRIGIAENFLNINVSGRRNVADIMERKIVGLSVTDLRILINA